LTSALEASEPETGPEHNEKDVEVTEKVEEETKEVVNEKSTIHPIEEDIPISAMIPTPETTASEDQPRSDADSDSTIGATRDDFAAVPTVLQVY
jgi:hypothetical protein